MRQIGLALLVGLAVVAAAEAHFVFIVPQADGVKGLVVFSDSLEPDDNADLLAKIAQTKLWLRGNKDEALEWKKTETAYEVQVPGKGTRVVGGVCEYGVSARGETPFLLNYYPKAVFGPVTAAAAKPWQRLPVEILPTVGKDTITLQVIAKGKPVAGAEVAVLDPEGKKNDPQMTDDKGEVTVKLSKAGKYGFRARVVERKAGEQDNKKYEEVRHYATLVLTAGAPPAAAR